MMKYNKKSTTTPDQNVSQKTWLRELCIFTTVEKKHDPTRALSTHLLHSQGRVGLAEI